MRKNDTNLVPNNNAFWNKFYKEEWSLDKAVDKTVLKPVYSEWFKIDWMPVIEYIKDRLKIFFVLNK